MAKTRYGVIGIKGAGKDHIKSVFRNPDAELTAIVDIDKEAVDAAAAKLSVAGFTDFRAMLEAGCVDAVSIATPHHTHSTIGLECLRAGIHTFIEKPLCNTVSEADALLSTARKNGLKICVGHQARLNQVPQAMKKIIESGNLGKVLHVLWTLLEFRPELYFRKPAWHALWTQAGGGVLPNQASHELDVVCFLIGRPAEVCALARTQMHSVEVEDTVCAVAEFENGALGSFQFTLNQSRCGNVQQIAGDRGILMIHGGGSLFDDRQEEFLFGQYEENLRKISQEQQCRFRQPQIRWNKIRMVRSQRPFWKRPGRLWKRLGLLKIPPSTHNLLFDSFIRAVREGGEPLVSGESALPVIELMNGMVLSALRKKTIRLPVDREEYDAAFRELCGGVSFLSKSSGICS